jgi:hypothetical protein
MFGFLKNLITGILGFITGLLPGKKGNGYYLELDESGEQKAPAAVKPVSPEPTVNGTKPAPTVAVEKTATVTKVEPSANGKAPKAEPAKAPAATTNGTKTPAAKTQEETTFAPKYLIPSASSSDRRRPGANMNSFLDMARQMKPSN